MLSNSRYGTKDIVQSQYRQPSKRNVCLTYALTPFTKVNIPQTAACSWDTYFHCVPNMYSKKGIVGHSFFT